MRAAKNEYHGAIWREKRAHWREYVSTLPCGNIWKAAKYAMDPSGSSSSSTCTPDLVDSDGTTASTPAQKATLFHAKFFPPAPNIPPPPPTAHPAPSACPTFTVKHILRAIGKTLPWKAPGPSGIPNVAI
jgi:hypothetical protein